MAKHVLAILNRPSPDAPAHAPGRGGALRVTATGGKLTSVRVPGEDGREVPGTLAADGLGWTPAAALAVSARYRVTARATDPNGLVTTAESAFDIDRPIISDKMLTRAIPTAKASSIHIFTLSRVAASAASDSR